MKDLNYYKNNAEENYTTTPISVLRYITELEKEAPKKQFFIYGVVKRYLKGNMLKNILKTIFGYVLVFIAMYLIGCFIQSSFNISDWEIDFKIFLCFATMLLGTVAQFGMHRC